MTQAAADDLSTVSPYNYEQPLPPVARANAVSHVPPAKKITFFKSGDPQFGGVKMAINHRRFKSFNALMDDLSHRVPLPFGVRTITTPQGIHCISELDQLEDGGCYLCSDKKYVKPISISNASRRAGVQRSGPQSGAPPKGAQESRSEDYFMPFAQQGARIPKKITLVKNGEIEVRRSIILNHRNARSFKTLLDEISELLQFTVKKLYTVDGRKIDSMQALLHCPSVLVCAGREPFKPIMMENLRKHSVEKLPGLTPRSVGGHVNENNDSKKNVNFGLKTKKSVIHPRSASSNRSMRFSLSSEKSFPNGLTTSPENGPPFTNNCPHAKAGDLVPSLENDDIEKRVHVNKDGSLSVEMKVRFRLLNDETLQWSTQLRKSSLMNKMPCEETGLEETSGVDPMQKMNPEASSEADDSLYPCDGDSYGSKLDESEYEETHCHSCGKKHRDYDIWKNPMHASQEEPGVRNTWHTRSSCSSTSSRRRIIRKKVASMDSIRTTSSEEYSEHVVQESSSFSETIENRVEYRSVKKCTCRSKTSPAVSHGEEQEDTRTNTANSQGASSLGLMSNSSCENNLDLQDAIEEYEVSKTCSQNGDENCFEASSVKCLKEEEHEVEANRAESIVSKSSLHSRRSKKKMHEETSNMARSMSSCSLKKAEAEDSDARLSSTNSARSRSSRCKSDQDGYPEKNPAISCSSSESSPKTEAKEMGSEQDDHEINEVSSTWSKKKPSESVKDDFSECEQCSPQGSLHSKAGHGHSKTSDNDEVLLCNASSSSRASKRSKPREIQPDASSDVSVSSQGSVSNSNKKNSPPAEDLRSVRKMSGHSKSSCEMKSHSTGDHPSKHSGSLHSNASSVCEAEAPPASNEDQSPSSTTKCYSKSSKGTRKRSHPNDSNQASSPGSGFATPDGNDGEEKATVYPETPLSRHGSMAESLCSKCDCTTEARNGNPPSVGSRVCSNSETKGKCTETAGSRTSDDGHSQSNVTQSSKSKSKKMKNIQPEVENISQASVSETGSMSSLHCPAPPKGKPSSKKVRPAVLRHSSSTSTRSESVNKEQKEVGDSSMLASSGSTAARQTVQVARNLFSEGKQKGPDSSCQQKREEELEEVDEPEAGDIMPSTLPNTSPEEVVQEWLSKIPPDTLLMKYEMDDGQEDCAEATTKIPCCANTPEISGEEKAEEEDVGKSERAAEEEAAKEIAEVHGANEEAEECPHQEGTAGVISDGADDNQGECSQTDTKARQNHKKDLPSNIQASVQIMKALLNSKQEAKFDRSNSLPEVSPTMGRKLSNSATALMTCFAGLQLLDEELLDPLNTKKGLNNSRHKELLSFFQSLWFGKDGLNSSQQEGNEVTMNLGFKGRNSTEDDFTPMSSSGVDVNSGSGGSGEESVAVVKDCTHLPQKAAESKAAQLEENLGNGADLSEAEEQDKKGDELSRPSTSCSQPKEEEKAEFPEGKAETKSEKDVQDYCDSNRHAVGGNVEEEDSKFVEHEQKREAGSIQETTPKESADDEATEQPAESPTSVYDERESDPVLEEQVEEKPLSDNESSVKASPETAMPTEKQKSIDPDPVWVLGLLKKLEEEFMTHYVSAMNELKVKWNLEENQQLDEMIEDLKDEVRRRIQASIEKELKKIQSRAGKRIPRPPARTSSQESTMQMEQRRRRLQTIYKKSLYSNRNTSQSKQAGTTTDVSLDIGEELVFSGTLGDDRSKQSSGEEEYCPCDTCAKKKMTSRPIQGPGVAARAPVLKAFDLKHILKLRKGDVEAESEMAACVSETGPESEVVPAEHGEDTRDEINLEEPRQCDPDPDEAEPVANKEKKPEQSESAGPGEQEGADEEVLGAPAERDEVSGNETCGVEEEGKEEEKTKEGEEKEEEEAEAAEEETAGGGKLPEEVTDGDDNQANASEDEEKAEGPDAPENTGGEATAGNGDAELEPQDDAEDKAVEETSPEEASEACSEAPAAEEENAGERADEHAGNEEEVAGDDPAQDDGVCKDEDHSEAPEMASAMAGDEEHTGPENRSEAESEANGNTSSDPGGEAKSKGGSKSSKMYPDSEEEEEDRDSSCAGPVDGEKDGADADDGQASKKKGGNAGEIDQDDLDF
ncbi:retinitis pigmentosa 1-like 1 protein [Alligator mississippiensis]|uniref:retinitis pigmentosa 1-like 1 protein n=1 Tax=Alligator mississippiensis TaxID=8496 RepID=UPI0028773BD3|nr:retinitis pigmentosa 1-like 1 protein [Alligator mississippiensis]